MHEALKITLYVLAILLFGSLLAPPIAWTGIAMGEAGWIPALADVPFSRYFNRAILLVALGLLWPFLKWIGFSRWQDLQLDPNPRRWHDLAFGSLIGVGALSLVCAGLLITDRAYIPTPFRWLPVLLALGTGVAVTIIEESFFRGALLGILRRRWPWHKALAFLSLFFAILHFIKPHKSARLLTDIHWYSGFQLLPLSFYKFADLQLVLVGFVTLLIFGWMLGFTVVKTRSLYMAMGLHGGFVFALRAFMGTTKRIGKADVWVGKELTTGIIPVLLLLLTTTLLWYLLRDRKITDA